MIRTGEVRCGQARECRQRLLEDDLSRTSADLAVRSSAQFPASALTISN